jgi:hypothetical protein
VIEAYLGSDDDQDETPAAAPEEPSEPAQDNEG